MNWPNQPSKSPYASPFFFMKKKDGKLQLVQDYWKINTMMVKNCTPLPLIKEVIDWLHGAWIFSKMDVHWRFNNICIKEGDKPKAAFTTSAGLFEPMVMFFGLTNSPATFQTMMNAILQPVIIEGKVQVYMDNIMVATIDHKDHQWTVWKVLQILKENNLFLKPKKCKFEKEEIDYLGVIIRANNIKGNPIKVAAIQDWPTPQWLMEVQ